MPELASNEEPLMSEDEARAERSQWTWQHAIRSDDDGDWIEGWAIGIKTDGSLWWRHELGLLGRIRGLKYLTNGWVVDGAVEVPAWARVPLLEKAVKLGRKDEAHA